VKKPKDSNKALTDGQLEELRKIVHDKAEALQQEEEARAGRPLFDPLSERINPVFLFGLMGCPGGLVVRWLFFSSLILLRSS